MRRNKRNSAGDTIVEVMIAIAVVSALMASAFVVVSRTTQNVRQTEEHGEALKLLEGQIEQLKTVAVTKPTDVFSRPTVEHPKKAFCVKEGTIKDITSDSLPATTDAAYGSCIDCSSHDECLSDTVVYRFGMVETSPNIFTGTVTWDGARGGQDKVEIAYKVFQ